MGATSALGVTSGIGVVGQLATANSQASAIKAVGKYKSTLADINSNLAGVAEKETIEQGDILASRQNLKTQQEVGAVKAVQGASGVQVGSGSSALVRSGMESVGAIDEMTIRNNAAKQAFGYKIAAINDTAEARMIRITASSEATQTLLAGGLQAVKAGIRPYAEYERYSRHLPGGAGKAQEPFPELNGEK